MSKICQAIMLNYAHIHLATIMLKTMSA